MSGPLTRRAALALAVAALAGCGGTAGGDGSPFDGAAGAGGRRGRARAAPRAAPARGATPMPGHDAILLADRGADGVRGWARTSFGPVPFAWSAQPGDGGSVPTVFWGGDRKGWDANRMLPLWDRQARRALDVEAVTGPRLTLARPWAGDPDWWRRPGEWRMMDEALAALGPAFGFGTIDAMGHSSGGTLAFAMAQETARVRLLVGAAPPLAVRRWNSAEGRPAPEVLAQYDPIDRIDRLAVLRAAIVADPADRVAPPGAWRPYLEKARALGLPVAFVAAQGAGPDRHGVLRPAARTLRALREIAA